MIKTSKGNIQVDIITIAGMKRSPIVVTAIPNNGGGLSYSVTHKPSGLALVPAKTDDLPLVIRCAKKLWNGLAPALRVALSREDFGSHMVEFNKVGQVVIQVRQYLDNEVAKRIKSEVAAELKAK